MSKILSIFSIVFLLIQFSEQLSLNEYLTLNHNEKLKLDEFRRLMLPQVPHDRMKKDAYLIKWLRDSAFDVGAAQKRLLNHIKWRQENHIDSILEEDWVEFDEDFKLYMEGCSRDGQPVVSLRLGDWDIRKYVLSGKTNKMLRYVDKVLEEGEIIIRRMQEDGQNVTQSIQIFDMSNFNLVQQGCGQCLTVLFRIVTTYDQNYPGAVHKTFLINMPEIAVPIWEVLRNTLNPRIRDTIFIYGKNRDSWLTPLLKEVNKNQLSLMYGGTNLEGVDYDDYRVTGEAYRCKNHL